MRFRLRTLLLVIAVVALGLARVSYLRRQAAIHRHRATRIITHITRMTEGESRDALDRLLAGGIPIKTIEVGTAEKISAVENESGDGQIIETDATADWQTALYHEALALKYERAAYRPWLFVSEISD